MFHPSRSVSRRALLGASVAVPAAGWLAGCTSGGGDPGPGPDGPPDEVTFLTSFGQFGRDAYPYAAVEQGLFAAANLEVTVEPGGGTFPNLTALLGGQAQFVVIDMAGAIIAAEELDGYVALAAIHQLSLGSVMAYTGSGISGPQDLEGRAVGLPPGAVTELLFPAYAQLAGVDVAAVEQVPLEAPQLVPALVAGQVDAIGQFVVGRPLVESAGGREVVVLPYSEWLDDMYGVCLFTTTELVDQDPGLCVRFRDALLAGLESSLADPQAAGEALAVHNPEMPAEVAAGELELMAPYARPLEAGQPLGFLDDARMARSVALMRANGLAGTALEDPADLVAFHLAPSADS